ncbi:MAG: YigZ family protein, partial [Syntrophomonadaceae bacterium]|nr:YigZ family protein [Syntrophomonadaceae bacterium]
MFYKTITEFVKTELIIKKSRFICMLIPLSCAREAEKMLSDIRQEYPGANHYCYAWIIRQEGSKSERSSDDGEPSGTAGWPILN